MSNITLENVVRSYNNKGLLQAMFSLLGVDKHLAKHVEKTIRVISGDVGVFNLIERRLAKTKLLRSVSTYGNSNSEFNEHLIGFTIGMRAARDYLMDKTNKPKHYAVYLTYFGELQDSDSFIITIRHISTQEVTLVSTVRGVN